MSQTQNPLAELDTAPMVCFLLHDPSVLYGPKTPAEAMDFVERWNNFGIQRNLPGEWVARPLVNR